MFKYLIFNCCCSCCLFLENTNFQPPSSKQISSFPDPPPPRGFALRLRRNAAAPGKSNGSSSRPSGPLLRQSYIMNSLSYNMYHQIYINMLRHNSHYLLMESLRASFSLHYSTMLTAGLRKTKSNDV